jgi:hypothetical protein
MARDRFNLPPVAQDGPSAEATRSVPVGVDRDAAALGGRIVDRSSCSAQLLRPLICLVLAVVAIVALTMGASLSQRSRLLAASAMTALNGASSGAKSEANRWHDGNPRSEVELDAIELDVDDDPLHDELECTTPGVRCGPAPDNCRQPRWSMLPIDTSRSSVRAGMPRGPPRRRAS